MTDFQKEFSSRKFGIFNHFLYGEPGGFVTRKLSRDEEAIEWNRQVNAFDTERIAYDLNRIGAGYYFITLMQGQRFMLAPNETYDRLCGTKPGECCAKRDLVADLIKSLKKYDIALCLYYTGDGPYRDEYCSKGMGKVNEEPQKVNVEFVKNWTSVLEEYAVRYGEDIKAWWIDGCYDANVGSRLGYTQKELKYYYDAVKKGNPKALIACNNGVKDDYYKWGEYEDMTSGEYCDFTHIPKSPLIDGALAHCLIPLGINPEHPTWGGWRCGGLSIDREGLKKYVDSVNAVGGVVTLDILIDHDGRWDAEQFAMLDGFMK